MLPQRHADAARLGLKYDDMGARFQAVALSSVPLMSGAGMRQAAGSRAAVQQPAPISALAAFSSELEARQSGSSGIKRWAEAAEGRRPRSPAADSYRGRGQPIALMESWEAAHGDRSAGSLSTQRPATRGAGRYGDTTINGSVHQATSGHRYGGSTSPSPGLSALVEAMRSLSPPRSGSGTPHYSCTPPGGRQAGGWRGTKESLAEILMRQEAALPPLDTSDGWSGMFDRYLSRRETAGSSTRATAHLLQYHDSGTFGRAFGSLEEQRDPGNHLNISPGPAVCLPAPGSPVGTYSSVAHGASLSRVSAVCSPGHYASMMRSYPEEGDELVVTSVTEARTADGNVQVNGLYRWPVSSPYL